ARPLPPRWGTIVAGPDRGVTPGTRGVRVRIAITRRGRPPTTAEVIPGWRTTRATPTSATDGPVAPRQRRAPTGGCRHSTSVPRVSIHRPPRRQPPAQARR